MYDRQAQARYDRRHNLPSAAALPAAPVTGRGPVKKIHVYPLRCDGCLGMFTDWQYKYHGACPRCGGNKIRGGFPNLWDRIKIFYWALTNNWRVVGWRTPEERMKIKTRVQ